MTAVLDYAKAKPEAEEMALVEKAIDQFLNEKNDLTLNLFAPTMN